MDMLAPTDADIRRDNDKVNLAYERMDEKTGHIQDRFIPESSTPAALQKKRNKEERQQFILSQLSLEAEAARLALYSDTITLANRASILAANGIEKYQQLLTQQKTQYQSALNQRARQLDGRYIFRDENDKAVHADGSAVDPAIAAGIEWNENDMTFSEHQQLQDKMLETRETIDAYHLYEIRVGEIQSDLETRKDELTAEEMQAYQDELIEGAPPLIQKELAPSDTTAIMQLDTSANNQAVMKPTF